MGCVIGFDTSNYTTSVCVVGEDGRIVSDCRRILTVREGERGLRQQEALFQHLKNLPELYHEAVKDLSCFEITAAGCSTRPRSVEGSYMPVFLAGSGFARVVADTLDIPCFEFSHQEGHIAAALMGAGLPLDSKGMRAFHLSGGTCELLDFSPRWRGGVMAGYRTSIDGRTMDISFGQFIDRIGVAMGYTFPAGADLDRIALDSEPSSCLTPVKVKDRCIHLSGIESQAQRVLETLPKEEWPSLAAEIFLHIGEAMKKMTEGPEKTLLMGGVSESQSLRRLFEGDDSFIFTSADMGRDNAAGIALMTLERSRI